MLKKINQFRDPMSGLTHFIGAVLALLALIYLLSQSIGQKDLVYSISYTVFGLGMIALYAASTTYHWINASDKTIKLFRKIDHIMIFVFIAATYTPVCLITLKSSWGYEILIAVWSIALFGLFKKIFWIDAPRFLSTAIYILMGWFIILAIGPLIDLMPKEGLFWMIIGGVMYTIGGIIYGIKKPNPWPDYFGFHEIFHVFVMLGSFSHFIVIAFYLE